MKTNTYTASIEHLHVSDAAIEAAIQSAKLRTAALQSNQTKLRYAAIAASVLLAGVGGYALYHGAGSYSPAVTPAPSPAATVVETQSTEAQKGAVQETKPKATSAPTRPTATPSAAAASQNADIHTDHATENSRETHQPASAQEPTKPAQPTEKPIQPATLTPTQASGSPIIIDPIEEDIPLSKLGKDGRLYMMIAETGLEQIDDPGAFTDEHVYYYETKFGRCYIQPLTIEPGDHLFPNDTPANLGNSLCYFYNSRGEILYTSPIRWD